MTKAKHALVLRHVGFEDLGSFHEVLSARGFDVEIVDVPRSSARLAQARDAALWVILGGPISVHDAATFPFLRAEQALLAERLQADAPCLGVCLGAQLMATALGGTVAPMAEKEIGWGPLVLTEAGRDSALRALGDTSTVLHWHGEACTLPPGATLLATNAHCPVQAFSHGRNGLALQFHVEATADALEPWYVGHVVELGLAGVQIQTLRAQASVHAAALRARSQAFLDAWLHERGL